MLEKRAQIAPPPNWEYRLGKGFEGFVRNCLLIRLFRKQSYFEGSETVQSLCKNDKNGSSYCSNIVKILKNKLDCFAYARNDDLCAEHTEKHLFSYSPIHLFTFKKAAFTLAEVLITLGIIGVVAALTLPTLIQNYKKQTYVNQLKKVVNTLENTAQMALAQEGVSAVKDTTLYCNLVNPYDCEYYSWENSVNDPIREEVIKKYFRTIEYNSNYNNGIIKIVLPDGAVIVMGSSSYGYADSDCGMFTVDVNGYKSPNEEGRDIFALGMTDKGKVIDCAYLSGSPYGVSVDSVCTCNTFAEEQYLENGCFYQKIVSDGWKMNY